MSDRSVQHILQSDLHLHPYKLQIVQSLNDQDKEVSLQFSSHFQGILTENSDLPNNLLMSGEADFHLHGIVNKQNFQYWSDAKSPQTSPRSLYDPKFNVWSAVWSRGVIGPYFFEDEDGKAITVTSQCYTEMINEFLVPKLPPKHNMLFQQNGATAHTAVISMAVLHFLFLQQVISRVGTVASLFAIPNST
jgi:hypothetical protein